MKCEKNTTAMFEIPESGTEVRYFTGVNLQHKSIPNKTEKVVVKLVCSTPKCKEGIKVVYNYKEENSKNFYLTVNKRLEVE